jgi:hypothetical protein
MLERFKFRREVSKRDARRTQDQPPARDIMASEDNNEDFVPPEDNFFLSFTCGKDAIHSMAICARKISDASKTGEISAEDLDTNALHRVLSCVSFFFF